MRTSLALLIGCVLVVGCKNAPATEPAKTETKKEAEKPSSTPRVITMEVTADGFVPSNIKLKAGEPVKFVVTRQTDETCATDLLIADTDIKVALPLKTAVEIAWTPPKAGNVKFGCAMDMMVSGMLVVE